MASTGTMGDGTTRMRTANDQQIHHWTCVSGFSEYVVVPAFGAAGSDSVAVLGCGGVGLNAIQGAKLAGAYPLIAVDISAEKLALASRFGATHTINAL